MNITQEHKKQIRRKRHEAKKGILSASRRIGLAAFGTGIDGIAYWQGHFTELKAIGTTVGLAGAANSLIAFMYNAHNARNDRRREREHDRLAAQRTKEEQAEYFKITARKKLQQNTINFTTAALGGAVSAVGLGIDMVAYSMGQFDWLTATGTLLITVSGADAARCALKQLRTRPDDKQVVQRAEVVAAKLGCG